MSEGSSPSHPEDCTAGGGQQREGCRVCGLTVCHSEDRRAESTSKEKPGIRHEVCHAELRQSGIRYGLR